MNGKEAGAVLMLAAILFPIAAGFALLPARRRSRAALERYVVVSAAVTAALALWAIARGGEGVTLLRLSGRLALALRVDGLSTVFGGMVSLLWVASSFYALEYIKHEGSEERFFAFFLAAFGVTLGVAFAANIFTMYFFYELLTLATLPLVMHAMDDRARYAGKRYVLYSMTGAALGFIAMVFLVQYGGGGDFVFGGVLRDSVEAVGREMLILVYVLGFFGFGAKAAVFPLHRWLLCASVAPTPVTALLHAVAVVKAGVFAVMRLTYYGFGPDLLRGTWGQWIAMGAAIFTIVFGSASALRTPHLKRRLAWSTISNLSYILLGVTCMSTAGLVAGLSHMIFHAVIKITLFFCAGAIFYKTGKEYTYQLEGEGREMPAVFACFTVASLGLMAVPPLAGFASKWRLGLAAVECGTVLGYAGAAALILSSLFTAMYLVSILIRAYFPRKARVREDAGRHDPNLWMTGPLAALSTASVALGLFAQPVIGWLSSLVG